MLFSSFGVLHCESCSSPVSCVLQAFARNFTERAREKERMKEKAKEKEKKAQQKKKKVNDSERVPQKSGAAAYANKQVFN